MLHRKTEKNERMGDKNMEREEETESNRGISDIQQEKEIMDWRKVRYRGTQKNGKREQKNESGKETKKRSNDERKQKRAK
jgi:hypothetical protein